MFYELSTVTISPADNNIYYLNIIYITPGLE